jgi:hypothetical protein
MLVFGLFSGTFRAENGLFLPFCRSFQSPSAHITPSQVRGGYDGFNHGKYIGL